MRRGLALMLGSLMVFSLAACGDEATGSEEAETLRGSSPAVTEEEAPDIEPETSEPIETSTEENNIYLLAGRIRKS